MSATTNGFNVIGKAVQRYENGPRDSLRQFCLSVADWTRS